MKGKSLISIVLATALVLLAEKAHAIVVTGYFEGFFLGVLTTFPDETHRGLYSDHARFYFAYETSKAPEPSVFGDCPAQTCNYSSESPDDIQWLWAAFDFGEFDGVAVPGTASWQSVFVGDYDPSVFEGDRFEVIVRADWVTSFGFINNDHIPGRIVGPSTMLTGTDLPTEFINVEGQGFGDDRQKVGGLGFEVEFEYHPTYLRISPVPEPSSVFFLAVGLGIWAARSRRLSPRRSGAL